MTDIQGVRIDGFFIGMDKEVVVVESPTRVLMMRIPLTTFAKMYEYMKENTNA